MLSKQQATDFLFTSQKCPVDDSADRSGKALIDIGMSLMPSLSLLPSLASALPATVFMSCIPIIIPVSTPMSFETESVVLTEEGKAYVKGILFSSVSLASLAVCDAFMGDMTRAVIKGLFAGLGWYVTRPEGMPSLSSFTVVSFLSGSVNGIAALQMMAALNGPVFSSILPMVIDYIRFSDIVFPLLCLGSSYCGWMLMKELRRASSLIEGQTGQSITGSLTRRRVPVQPSASDFRPFQGVAHSLSTAA